IRLRIVVRGDPNGAAAVLPLIAVFRPGFAAWLSRRWNRIRLPKLFTGIRIKCRNKTANAKLPTRCADQNLSVSHKRGHRDVVAVLVFLDRRCPDFFACLHVNGDKHGLTHCKEDLVAVQCDTAAGLVRDIRSFGSRSSKAPKNLPRLRIDGDYLVAWRGDKHHAVVDHRWRLVSADNAGRKHPYGLEPVGVLCRDLIEWTVPPAVVSPPDHQPVAVVRLPQPFHRDRFVVLQNRRNRNGRLLRLCGWRRLLLRDEGAGNEHERDSTSEKQEVYILFAKHTCLLEKGYRSGGL